MNEDTQKWLATTPVEALLCRDLRHAWPRPPAPAAGGRRSSRKAAVDGAPPSSENIMWSVLAAGTASSPRVLERTMLCAAGCQVRRVEVFVVRADRLVRTGKPKLKYPSWYRRTRTDPDEPLERLDVEVLRGNIVTRLYPGIAW